jgi:hypothetical protein
MCQTQNWRSVGFDVGYCKMLVVLWFRKRQVMIQRTNVTIDTSSSKNKSVEQVLDFVYTVCTTPNP